MTSEMTVRHVNGVSRVTERKKDEERERVTKPKEKGTND